MNNYCVVASSMFGSGVPADKHSTSLLECTFEASIVRQVIKKSTKHGE